MLTRKFLAWVGLGEVPCARVSGLNVSSSESAGLSTIMRRDTLLRLSIELSPSLHYLCSLHSSTTSCRTPALPSALTDSRNNKTSRKKQNLKGENYIHNGTGHPHCRMIDWRVYGSTALAFVPDLNPRLQKQALNSPACCSCWSTCNF